MLVVTGGPGIGKTTILDAARRLASDQGIAVLSCSPDASEVTLAFGGLVDLFEDISSDRFTALPIAQHDDLDVALRRRPADARLPDPLTVAAGARAALAALAMDAPVLVVVDDVQWLDPSTAAVLAYVLRRLRTERVGLLLGHRTEADVEREPDLGLLGAVASQTVVPVETLALDPLSLSAMHHVIRARTGEVLPRPLLHRITDVADGNPFLALTLVASMLEEGRWPGVGEPLPAPGSILDHAERRVAKLSPEAREILLVIASSSPATVSLVERVVGHDPGPALAAAREAGIVAARTDVLRFAHPLYAECVVHLAPVVARADAHRRIADVLHEPEARARHLALSSQPPGAEIADALEAGAIAARAHGGLRAAAELLVAATRATPSNDRTAAHRRAFTAAELIILAGDREAARSLLQDLAAQADAPLRQRAAGLLAEIVASDGDVEAAQAILRDARATVTEPATTARIELDLAYTSLVRLAPGAAMASAAVASAASRRSGDDALVAEALAYEGLSRLLAGHDPDEPALAEALRLEDRARPPYMGLPASGVIGLIRAFTGQHDEARALLAASADQLDALGDDADLAHVLLWTSWLEMRAGRLDTAASAAVHAATMAESTGSELLRAWAIAQSALVEAHRGLGAATEALIAGSRRGPISGGVVDVWVLAAAGLARLAEGDVPGAAGAYAPVLSLDPLEPLAEPVLGFFVPDAVEAVAAAGDPATAQAMLEPFDAVARTRDRTWAIAAAHRARAAIDAAEGRLDAAVVELGAALTGFDATDLPLDRARTLLALGRIERRLGERRAARTHLEAAEAAFEDIGALGWARQASAELGRVPGRRSTTGMLTDGEQRVAELSGAGRTNREVAAMLFVSPKTVEANLARIYRKLGISTRAELGAWLAGALDRDDGAAT